MLDQPVNVPAEIGADTPPQLRPALDFQAHLADLEARGLLVRIDRPIDKDTELHPLVRWQFLGGIAGERAARLPVHQRDRRQGPALRHAGRGRRARGLAGHLCGRHGPRGERDRRAPGCAPSPIRSRRSRSRRRAVPGGRDHRRRSCAAPGGGLAAPAGAGVDAGLRCRALSHRDALHHPRSRQPASRTWAPTGRR